MPPKIVPRMMIGRMKAQTASPDLGANLAAIVPAVLAPMRALPRHPLRAARFAGPGIRSADGLSRRFTTDQGRALLSGVAGHALQPLNRLVTGGFASLLTVLAHHVGWPVIEGGSQRITDALVAALAELGGVVETGHWVSSLDELPPARATLFDVAPAQLVAIAGDRLPPSYRRSLQRYRYGPGVCLASDLSVSPEQTCRISRLLMDGMRYGAPATT